MGNQAEESEESRRTERGNGVTQEPAARQAGEVRKRKSRRLSSEMLKWKGSKENGSQALIPEERSKREAPVERLWERNREGRKETNRKLST